jgi:hypothetical protein
MAQARIVWLRIPSKVIGVQQRWAIHLVFVVPVASFHRLGPFGTMRWVSWIRRSHVASTTVGSPERTIRHSEHTQGYDIKPK